MNCKQFNAIPLEEVLRSLGHLPTRQNEKEAWFLNPFANESEASFKLDKQKNLWFLYSEGIGGNNTDFMIKYLNASVSEVLSWASIQNFSSFHQQNQIEKIEPNYKIDEILHLQNPNLKEYLQERGLSSKIHNYLKEIRFTIGDKKLYAIGFENQSEGFELRNSFYKGSLLKKDISIINLNRENISNIQNEKRGVAVFEGFMDALSFIEMKRSFKGDILVMNSTSLVGRTKEQLKNYSEISLFLDNDNAGYKCKSEILKSFPDAIDCSGIYSDHKDLNEYLIHKIKTEKNLEAKHPPEGLQESREKNKKQEYENKQSFKRRR